MARKKAKRQIDKFEIGGRVLKPGMEVMLRPLGKKSQPYIARIERIEEAVATTPSKSSSANTQRVMLVCRWYYRPEESKGGRRPFHGSKELFLSNHMDECYPEAVEGECRVHSFQEYTKLQSVKADDYFCRFEYDATDGTFSPDRVAVYCTCEMPYNPDDLMVQCEKCTDWFHPGCVNLRQEELKNLEKFVCPGCRSGQPPPH